MSQRNGHATGGFGSPTHPADAPPAKAPAASPAPPVHDRDRAFLQQAFAGRLPSIPIVTPVQFFDASLDATQQDAVCRSLASPDLFLIQGPSGTGKTRIAAEIIRQTTRSGGRVLFLSPEPGSLDSVLPALAADQQLVRSLGTGESTDRLPPAIAALTEPGRRAAAREKLLADAARALEAAENRLRRAELLQPLWDELVSLRSRQAEREQERSRLTETRTNLTAGIQRLVHSTDEPVPYFVQRLRGANASHARRLASLDCSDAELKGARTQAEQKKATAEALAAELRPLADSLRQKRWYSPSFWKARSDATLPQRLTEAEAELTTVAAALEELVVRGQKLAAERRQAEEEHQAELNRWMEAEVARRKAELDTAEAEHDRQAKADTSREQQISTQLGSQCADHVAGQAAAQAELAEAKHVLELARTRSTEVATRIEELIQDACPEASIVAGPIAGVAAESQFDLLVIDDAHRLTEGDFLAAARLAPRWVLMGEPTVPTNGRSRVAQPDLFARLASALRHDVWIQDSTKLVCRLHSVRGADRKRLECEPVADSPEIELRVFAPLDGEPTLAEVAFPATFDPAAAREFLFREMGEVTCQPRERTARWETVEGGSVVRFASADSLASFATIGTGVCEELAGLVTKAIHFDSTWSADDASAWVSEHVGQREPGRLVALGKSYRACPGLAHWLNRAFATGFAVPPVDNGRHVEFLAVPDLDPRRRREPNGRPQRVGGAGYEIDLADPKQRAALHADFSDLPARGFVNVPEAQALVRYLESQGGAGLAVTSPFPAQVTVLRRLFARSARLANVRVLDPGEASRHECDLLVVSLTRSHVGRAVTFGDAPAVLASLLSRARKKVLFAGDPGTLARRLQWEGPVDHLDAADAARERGWVAALADCPRVSSPRYRPAHGESVRA